jgi:hypothetical protein
MVQNSGRRWTALARRRSRAENPSRLDLALPEVWKPLSPQPRAQLLRVLEGVVIDSPIVEPHDDARQWAATCRPDAAAADGWTRTLWWESATHRGWLPVDLYHFDVVEFAADVPIRRRWRRTRLQPVRWCGVAIEEAPLGLIVYRPYPTLDRARADSSMLRAALDLQPE